MDIRGAIVTWGRQNTVKAMGTVIDSYRFKKNGLINNENGDVLLVKTTDGRYTLKLEHHVRILENRNT